MNRLFPSRGQSGSSLGCRPAHASKLRGRGFPSKERASFSEELLAANAGATARLRAGGTEEESPLERGRRAAWSLIIATVAEREKMVMGYFGCGQRQITMGKWESVLGPSLLW